MADRDIERPLDYHSDPILSEHVRLRAQNYALARRVMQLEARITELEAELETWRGYKILDEETR